MSGMIETIGFIGTGNLGRPIAANLIEAGYGLIVHNRTASKADPLIASGATRALTAADAVRPGGIVVTLLWDDASVESVVASDGFLSRLGRGGVHVSMSTISPDAARRLAAVHSEHGSTLVQAPVFGRPEAAEAKKLWIVYAGPDEAKARIRPLFEAMGAQGVFDFGHDVAASATVKLVGNFLLVSAAASLTEGLSLAKSTGLDPQAVLDMLTSTLFPSPIYVNYGRAIAQGTAIVQSSPIPMKDLGLFKSAAHAAGSPAAISNLLLENRK